MTTTAKPPVEERKRPWPAVNEDNRFFWDGIAVGELRIQKCNECETLIHPPRPHCAGCGSFDPGYVVSSGIGTVYSYVVFHAPLAPPFVEPYSIAVVELAEGTRIVSQIIGIPPSEVRVGMPVALEFVEVEPGLTLPLFRPTES
ncbi:OB-fold domain-containing protein [Microbispora sp. H11081]|uniref:Zn-ribbon domain-containing OB-fold protein n=1 Tax=Microbispora sp. H11081 TaxID=2729107 RepID=UPI001474596F|nr:OB-fold domain-containing protein [Microbispora sp. H11081]